MPPEQETAGTAPDLANAPSGPGTVEAEGVSSFAAFEAAQAAAEAPVVEEAEGEETPVLEGDEPPALEGDEPEAGDPPAAETKPADGKLSKGQQKKADRAAAAARRAGEAALDAEKAETARLKAENADLKAGKKPAAATVTADDAEPDPDKFEYGTLDPAYQKAVRAFDKATLKKELVADQLAEAAKAKASETTAAYEKQVDTLLEEHDDYYEVVEDGFKAGKWVLPEGFSPILMDSPVGAKIAYELGKNPAESRRIAALPVLRQAAEFGKMEARFSEASPKGKSGKAPAVSKADPPVDPVRGSGGKFKANAATTDFAAFERTHSHLLNP